MGKRRPALALSQNSESIEMCRKRNAREIRTNQRKWLERRIRIGFRHNDVGFCISFATFPVDTRRKAKLESAIRRIGESDKEQQSIRDREKTKNTRRHTTFRENRIKMLSGLIKSVLG